MQPLFKSLAAQEECAWRFQCMTETRNLTFPLLFTSSAHLGSVPLVFLPCFMAPTFIMLLHSQLCSTQTTLQAWPGLQELSQCAFCGPPACFICPAIQQMQNVGQAESDYFLPCFGCRPGALSNQPCRDGLAP